jgi:hypothetical protein
MKADSKQWIQNKMGQVQQQLRSRPALWAGVATGLGLALGIAGRIIRRRRARPMPMYVLVEAC